MEQTRDFSHTPEVPSHELMQGPTQAGFVEFLPSYEEMTVDELFSGPSSMETRPDLEQVQVLDEGIAVINCRTVEWWPNDPQKGQLEEYLMEETKSLHTNFVLPDQRLALCYTCPVYFGSFENKQKVLDALCNEIHSKVLNQWGNFPVAVD